MGNLFLFSRTRAVVVVGAVLKHPDSVNRTKLDCVLNGKPAVCVNLMLCFNYSGRTVPGYIGKLLNKSFSILAQLSSDGKCIPICLFEKWLTASSLSGICF